MMRQLWWRISTLLALVILLSSAYLLLPQTFLSLDNRLRDFLFILRGPVAVSDDIVIVDIDEKSIQTQGQWPWSRNKVATLIQNISDAEAGIIGLDIVFSEADKSSPSYIASQLDYDKNVLPDYDKVLSETVANTPTIGGYFFTFSPNNNTTTPLIPAVYIAKGGSQQHYLINPSNLVLNLPLIQDAFYSSGFFNNTPDEGGMIRKVPLLMRYEKSIYPSLPLEMVRILTGAQQVTFNNKESGLESISMGELQIPTDRFSRLAINYRGPSRSYRYLSASDVLSKKFDKVILSGKFVLVGTSAIGLTDLRATPFDDLMPGVEVHANIIDNLINQDFISLPQEPEQLDLLLITLTVVIAFILFSMSHILLSGTLLIGLTYGMYLFYMQMLFSEGIVLNILFPLMALMLSFVTALIINYIITLRQKREVMAVFAKKVSASVMNDLLQNSSEELLVPRNKEVTIFFSDIRSFTNISEKLGNPERVISMLNTYMTPMVETITTQEGTIDKFIGDAVMAYWNAPSEVTNHADKAVSAACIQLQQLALLNIKLQNEFELNIEIGIGIHTGEVTIGEMGSVGRSDYTIIGDNVNLASRLEGLTKFYGAHIIISEQTKRALTGTYRLRSLDIVQVKGKTEAVEIFEVVTNKEVTTDELHHYEAALTLYRNKQLPEALDAFESLSQQKSSLLYKLYLSRCHTAITDGVENFTLITKMQSK